MSRQTTILLKLTGAVLRDSAGTTTPDTIKSIALQIKQLYNSHRFGIVIGGGNLFRGSKEGALLSLSPARAHEIGMLATLMNALIIHDIFIQCGVQSVVLSAVACPQLVNPISSDTISAAFETGKTIIFAGGTGNPFLTTDSCALLRALQLGAQQVWKGTNVDGIYTKNPTIHPDAQKIARISYDSIIHQKLGIMDLSAYCIAQEHTIPIRVFNIFKPNILIDCAHNESIGSSIDKE